MATENLFSGVMPFLFSFGDSRVLTDLVSGGSSARSLRAHGKVKAQRVLTDEVGQNPLESYSESHLFSFGDSRVPTDLVAGGCSARSLRVCGIEKS